MDAIYLGNDHVVEISNLTDEDGATITAATVEANLLDASDNIIAGPITLAHQGSGTYQGTLDAAIQLIHHRRYILRISATAGTRNGRWDLGLVSQYRD